jgi:hypothetical protein
MKPEMLPMQGAKVTPESAFATRHFSSPSGIVRAEVKLATQPKPYADCHLRS